MRGYNFCSSLLPLRLQNQKSPLNSKGNIIFPNHRQVKQRYFIYKVFLTSIPTNLEIHLKVYFQKKTILRDYAIKNRLSK